MTLISTFSARPICPVCSVMGIGIVAVWIELLARLT